MSVSGRTWGEPKLDGAMLAFSVGGKHAFEVAMGDVSTVALAGKNEVRN